MTYSVLLELVRHKTWATLKVIELCQTLSPERLEAVPPGSHASPLALLRHLVLNDINYFRVVAGEAQPPASPDADLAELAERFAELAPKWETLALSQEAADREITTPLGITLGVAPIAQSIHHADVHRAHVLSALGAQGIKVPELDVWDYGTIQGFVRPAEGVR